MDSTRREALDAFYEALTYRGTLGLDVTQPKDERFYTPLHAPEDDPTLRLFSVIERPGDASFQVIPGFRGTGKTTEFSRLAEMLRKRGYVVARVDLDEYVNMNEIPDIVDLLFILEGAIDDAFAAQDRFPGRSAAEESWWTRAGAFLRSEVEIRELSGKAFGAGVKAQLLQNRSVRRQVREAARDQIPRYVEEVHAFHADMLERIRREPDESRGTVVILDSFEHLRAPDREGLDLLHRAVRDLFLTHGAHLRLPRTHVVFTVPSFLALEANGLEATLGNGVVRPWSSCRVRNRKREREVENIARLTRLVERRGDWKLVLPDRAALEELILSSGGSLRDLLNMLCESVFQATVRDVDERTVDRVKAAAARAYQPLYADERELLKQIARERDIGAVRSEDRDHASRFLDAHVVLCYLNEDYWFDVHPLVKDLLEGHAGGSRRRAGSGEE